MCELLGLNFNQPVNCSLSFRGFIHRGEKNPDGWGIAYWQDGIFEIKKETQKATDSDMAWDIPKRDWLTSHIFIAHVRNANRGGISKKNTHPFKRNFRSGDVVFAHNGTIDSLSSDKLKYHPYGDTDSELLFCSLLTQLDEQKIDLKEFSKIENILREFNKEGKMNLLFSDGDRLFAYRDINYNNLWMVKRRAPFGNVAMLDEDWVVNLDHMKQFSQGGYVIATQPLTDEKWEEIPKGSLYVFQFGYLVYPNNAE